MVLIVAISSGTNVPWLLHEGVSCGKRRRVLTGALKGVFGFDREGRTDNGFLLKKATLH
jgi:hypothetical protein